MKKYNIILEILLVFTTIIFVLYGMFFYNILNNKEYNIKYISLKYKLSDKKIANLTKSQFYIKNNNIYYLDLKGNLIYKCEFFDKDKINHLNKNFYTYNYDLGIKYKNTYYFYNIFKYINESFNYILYLLLFLFVSLFIIFKGVIKHFEDVTLVKIANIEALTASNSLIMLTENIHHELNTPLEVIINKIDDLFNIIENEIINQSNIKCKDKHKKLTHTYEDAKYFIYLSIDQIKGILDNMKNFKSLKYSNGNKNIYDIVKGAVDLLKVVSGSVFEEKIDENLKNYKIDHSSGFKNSDLTNILINHFKNSLEANADKIEIKKIKYSDKKLYISIIDDGNGIPTKFQKNIFKANTSSKQDDMSLRGNGMFLNKYLLENFGGCERLSWSEVNKGTEFIICFSSLPIHYKYEDNNIEKI